MAQKAIGGKWTNVQRPHHFVSFLDFFLNFKPVFFDIADLCKIFTQYLDTHFLSTYQITIPTVEFVQKEGFLSLPPSRYLAYFPNDHTLGESRRKPRAVMLTRPDHSADQGQGQSHSIM